MVPYVLEPLTIRPGLSVRPVGAHLHDNGVTFRVWAPKHAHVRVATGDGTTTRYVTLERDADGTFMGRDEHGRAGDLYWYQLEDKLSPDPASRFQPCGVDGPSQVVDATRYEWTARAWSRPSLRGRVLYELHVGTFTSEGTFEAAAGRLGELRELGVNAIELMPLGDFAGDRNWGYDGVMIFAPARCYGTPDDLRALVDAAHAHGIAVVGDVVYNHLGPCGNVLPVFSDSYFHHEHESIWGTGLNFDGRNSEPVREFFLQNACMWLDDYRMDGLRLDAVHAIHDRSSRHIVVEIVAAAHERGAFVIAEDERNEAGIITPQADGGWGADGIWADDLHHSLRVAVTGQSEGHYANYTGSIEERLETLRRGWFYHGQYFASWKRGRGTDPSHLPPERFVVCISNHDQIGNRPLGDRLSEAIMPEQYRAMSVLLCLVPYTPLLFMGQEWAARSPFPFFTDHPGELGANIGRHRIDEFMHHGAAYPPDVLARMPDPQAEGTFRAAKLDWSERTRPPHAGVLALYRACLQLRTEHEIFQSAPRERWTVEQHGDTGIRLHWRDKAEEWVLVVALERGADGLSPPDDRSWECVLDSNEVRFGGSPGAARRGPLAIVWRTAG